MKIVAISFFAIFIASTVQAKKDELVDVSMRQLTEDIKKANRIIVLEEPMKNAKILYKSKSQKDINDLIQSINIKDTREKFHCMCIGSPAIYLYRGNTLLNIISNHHGVSIRTSKWNSDAEIIDVEKWLNWFDARNIKSPREEFESASIEQKKYDEYRKNWISVMPKSIIPIWESAQGNFGGLKDSILISAFTSDTTNEKIKIRQLLKWYGSGAGPWSGFPSYEEAPSILLNKFSISKIINNGNIDSLDFSEKHGLARYICEWNFTRKRSSSRDSIPKHIKSQLWDVIKSMNDTDKTQRASQYLKISD